MHQPRVFVSTGDVFGDILAGSVARWMRAMNPGVRIGGIGGPQLAAAGGELVADVRDLAAVGFSIVRKVPSVLRRMSAIREAVEHFRPDVVLMIASPGLNLALGAVLRTSGVKRAYFLPPELWAWTDVLSGQRRAARSLFSADLLIPGNEFEVDLLKYYAEIAGAPCSIEWFGNPVADCPIGVVDQRRVRSVLALPEDGPLVGLFPGSRVGEVDMLLDPMLGAAEGLLAERPDTSFVLPVAVRSLRDQVSARIAAASSALKSRLVALYPFERGLGATYRAMACCRTAIIASGSVSLELAWHRVPSVICYRLPPWQIRSLLRTGLVRLQTQFVGLPNVLAGEMVCPERLQDEVTHERLKAAALPLIDDGPTRDRAVQRLGEIRGALGEWSVLGRVAQRVLELGELDVGGGWESCVSETSPGLPGTHPANATLRRNLSPPELRSYASESIAFEDVA